MFIYIYKGGGGRERGKRREERERGKRGGGERKGKEGGGGFILGV